MKLTSLLAFLLFATICSANTIHVSDAFSLVEANKKAKPGDIIILKNGEWKNVSALLTCRGTALQPIRFKAETPGKLLLTGNSSLSIGGEYIIVDGWSFVKGFSGNKPVISFRSSQKDLAKNCRVTNSSIADYNNPKRGDENYWIAFYGSENRLDHCSFLNKQNFGVLIAVMLEETGSRENHHSIDSNYFGLRPALGSNGGEIIRVGVSGTSMYNSFTNIHHNLFENCDGEVEIISLKSGGNFIRDNIFKTCQGSVVLRHGNNNTVEHNIFDGANKPGTGGVRVINEGQWVVNNLFVNCTGSNFRAPLAVMSGVPNSPVNRYMPVRDAVIANNSFVNCSRLSFGEGHDTERSQLPKNVFVANNLFLQPRENNFMNLEKGADSIFFFANYIDKLNGSSPVTGISTQPYITTHEAATKKLSSNIEQETKQRLKYGWPKFAGSDLYKTYGKSMEQALRRSTGSKTKPVWETVPGGYKLLSCKDFAELKQAISSGNSTIRLTGTTYHFTEALLLKGNHIITTADNTAQLFTSTALPALFIAAAGSQTTFKKVDLVLANIAAENFILSDTASSSANYKISIEDCYFSGVAGKQNLPVFFNASKGSYAPSLIVINNSFNDLSAALFVLDKENDDKGWYNAENIIMENNKFINIKGPILSVYRGGNDESTMGPLISFKGNRIMNTSNETKPLVYFSGVQQSISSNNLFINSNKAGTTIKYADRLRADHLMENNSSYFSGTAEKNQFVKDINNISQ
ncbi:MAG: TonB-dependent receptor [Ferruginibacter sp.]|nr:TonB-dependent receptor [Ferruginibacter sp.]